MKWDPQQADALTDAGEWMRDPSSQLLLMGGYAGTGKTTLAKHLVANESKRWLFAAFTGKAAHVMRQKGCHGARTLHSLIYRPAGESKAREILEIERRINALVESMGDEPTDEQHCELARLQKARQDVIDNNRPRFAVWELSELADPDVAGVVVDEASMVDANLGADLESFHKKILVLMDPAQLPPVGSGGYYTKRDPDIMLTEVHRQAKESGILQLATLIREGEDLPATLEQADCVVRPQRQWSREELAMLVMNADQTLCGRNATRHAMNRRHRELLGRTDRCPVVGDRVVCLRNDRALGIYNGSQWRVLESAGDAESRVAQMSIESEDDRTQVEVSTWLHHMLGCKSELDEMGLDRRDLSEFDWSYAMTVHKAQGSQWDEVVLFDESRCFRQDWRKWLYTGITRAARKLTVVS